MKSDEAIQKQSPANNMRLGPHFLGEPGVLPTMSQSQVYRSSGHSVHRTGYTLLLPERPQEIFGQTLRWTDSSDYTELRLVFS